MASICFYFQVHQPWRLRRYRVFDRTPDYFDEQANRAICEKVANKCYLPANRVILDLVRRHEGRFRVSYSITGVALDQFERYMPAVLESFQALAQTGCVEILSETYYHSLSFLYSPGEFREQVKLHAKRVKSLFGQTPKVFRNTELIFNNDVARAAEEMGYSAVICEGVDNLLGYRSPTYLYTPPGGHVKLLLKNYRLSDDVAFRFSNRGWADWPLTADKFARWVHQVNGNGYVVNLFMDYETFGEHQWADTGIFDFLYHLPDEVFKLRENDFKTPSECAAAYAANGEYDAPHMISWADTERDLSAWLGNAMQANALYEIYRMEDRVKATRDPAVIEDWRRLQTSDHFYYMCTKYFADGDVHKYFNPYDSPYDSYINYMNVMDNLNSRVRAALREPASGPAEQGAWQAGAAPVRAG